VTRHLPALAGLPEGRVVALAETDRERLDRVGARFGVERRHVDPEALIDDPNVDVVAICVPAQHHAPIALRALDAGKHVLLEKPIALSLDDAETMAARAGEGASISMIGFNLRWHRLVRRALDTVRSGTLGSIDLVRAVITGPKRYRSDIGPWAGRRELGGGSLIETAVHHYDLWRFLCGSEVEDVFACSSSRHGDDNTAVVSARMRSGALVSAAYCDGTSPESSIILSGSDGSLHLSLLRFDGFELRRPLEIVGAPRTRVRQALRTLAEVPEGLAASRAGGVFLSSYRAEWAHFLGCIRAGRATGCTFDDGVEALRIALAATHSTQTGRPVRIAEAPRFLGIPVA
jgi:myo-inositol 2-dehydrogenase / D-chiro-inositol 1-dehydrogenase